MATRGTYVGKCETGYEPRHILAYKNDGLNIGVTFFDVTVLKIYVGSFTDDENFS